MAWRAGASVLARALTAAVVDTHPQAACKAAAEATHARRFFKQALAALASSATSTKADRQLFDVKWHDEYATLGDDPEETHKAMVAEDARLRKSALFTNPLRKTVFDEILRHRRRFALVRNQLHSI